MHTIKGSNVRVIFSEGAVKIYRLGHWLHSRHFFRLGQFFTVLNRLLYATVLPSSATIGTNFTLGYGGLGVVIHSLSTIGNNVHICQNVTIGRNPNSEGVPSIGNNVYIGPGAVVSGKIHIGDNSVIGANSVVLHNVSPGEFVAGVPAKCVKPVNK